MKKGTNNISNYTAKKLESTKLMLLVGVLIATLTDVAAIVAISVGGYDGSFLVAPIILLVFDVLFLLCSLCSNFRFRYAIISYLIYIAVVVIMLIVREVMPYGMLSSGDKAFTLVTSIVWIAVHVLTVIMVIVTSLTAAKRVKPIVAFVAVIALAAMTVGYGVITLSGGYFGQKERVLTYTYSEATDSYEITGVLNGKSKVVNIPEQIDGKKVSAVDCSVFAAKGVSEVFFNTSLNDVSLVNFDNLAKVDTDKKMSIYTLSGDIDNFKSKLYAMTSNRKQNFFVANNAYPHKLDAGKTYITFTYDEVSYDKLTAENGVATLITTWFGDTGSTFSLDGYKAQFPMLDHTNINDNADLKWAYDDNGGYILNELVDGAGNAIDGMTVSSGVKGVAVTLDKVYKLFIGADNDDLFTPATELTQIDGDNKYRLVTVRGENWLTGGFNRSGFDLSWKARGENEELSSDMTSFTEMLTAKGDNATIYPVYALKAPKLTVTSSSDNNKFMYGDNVRLNVLAEGNTDKLTYSYEYDWLSGETPLGHVTAQATLGTIRPDKSGAYTVKVVTSANDTSLTNESYGEIHIEIAKKVLNFAYSVSNHTSKVYNKIERVVTSNAAEQSVAGDIITYTIENDRATNAGNYTATFKLDEEFTDRYEVAADSASFAYAIERAPLTLNWTPPNFTYNGEKQTPTKPTASGIVSGDSVGIEIVVSGGVNAGNHVATASIDNENYTVPEATYTYEIKKYNVGNAQWSHTTDLVYNGTAQLPTAKVNVSTPDGELTLNVTGSQVNAGDSYQAQASLTGAQAVNYDGLTNASTPFIISPKTITLTWSETPLVYNGAKQLPSISTVNGLVGDDDAQVSVAVESGHGVNAENNILATATIANTNYTFDSGSSLEKYYDIAKRGVSSILWTDTNLTYTGAAQNPVARFSGQGNDGVLVMNVQGGASDAGDNYTATAILNAEQAVNYVLAGANDTQNFTINAKTVTLVWDNPTLTYSGAAQYPTVSSVLGLVGGDDAQVSLDTNNIVGGGVNAGQHTITAIIGNSNYKTNSATKTYTIGKKTLNASAIEWTNLTFTYDGTAKAPTAKIASGVTQDGQLTLTVSGEQTNAGNYTATASLTTTQAANYALTGTATKQFTINAKTATLVWVTPTLTYNGTVQKPAIPTLNGLVSGDNANITLNVTRGDGIEALQHEVTATVGNANYSVSELTYEYTIGKKTLNGADIEWTNLTLTYSGASKMPTAKIASGVAADGQLTLAVDGAQVVAGQHTATAGLRVEQEMNYELTGDVTEQFTISPMQVTVQWASLEMEETGSALTPTATANLLTGETPLTVTVYELGTTTPTTAVAAGSYTVVATIEDDNYELVSASATFVITAAEVIE